MSTSDTLYYVLLILWLLVPLGFFSYCSRRGRLAGVLVFAYLVGFFMEHWMGALVHASPQSGLVPLMLREASDTASGFYLSTLGLLAFGCGVLFAGRDIRTPRRAIRGPIARQRNGEVPPLFIKTLFGVGVALWVLSFTPVASLPSASAVLSAGRNCVLLAVCLLCWSAWLQKRMKSFRLWLATAISLPFITVVTQGFLGYGIMMLATIIVFIAMFYRPRWVLLAGLIIGIYAAISFWVAYFNHRDEIRAAVWGGADYATRFSTLANVFTSIEPFDLTNPDHLAPVDMRLNQNWLIGSGLRITPVLVPYEDGETIYGAILAIIPRVIWPDKPITAGSGDYVSKHTGIGFAENTSVGMGQVFEFYINFGVPGVLIGLFILGLVLRRLDLRLTKALIESDFQRVQFYFLVGMGLLQVQGSLAEMVAAGGGGAVLSVATSKFMRSRMTQGKRKIDSGKSAGPVVHPIAR